MKKLFEDPIVEVMTFVVEDVINTSFTDPDEELPID